MTNIDEIIVDDFFMFIKELEKAEIKQENKDEDNEKNEKPKQA